ncbi:SDR family oxidoreductase [Ochrobactrum teleogrylli]|uniref:SDR family oxidoreductase n=1 Tax=Ochrobactrum teleogrylli TaxID=2479765 RepID=UPI00384B5FB5
MTAHWIRGKTILIAGSAKNLGGLIARDLAAQGAKAIAVRINTGASKPAADETVAAIKAAGAGAFAFQADLTTAGAVEKLFNEAQAAMSSIDIAINTVGKVLKESMVEISEAEYDEMTAVNSKSAFFFLKEVGKHISDSGKVCNVVTSLLGAYTPFYATYAGTKAPVEHFTRSASKEFGERGISVTAIGPGRMDTPFFYPAEGVDAVAYHKTAAPPSGFSKTGLRHRGHRSLHLLPRLRRLVDDRPTILVNDGYTTK